MANQSPFCTCPWTDCPNHPSNHDQGCTLCIAKNLNKGEIPCCFFNQVDDTYAGPGFFRRDFARLVLEKECGAQDK